MWYLNKVSPLDEVIKEVSIDRKEKRAGDPPASRGWREDEELTKKE